MPVRHFRLMAFCAGALTLLPSCSSSLPSSVGSAPVLSVATALWPLAQVASMIGGSKVAVADVVPDGVDPLAFAPGPAASDTLRSAGLVLEVGGGFQPGVRAAADGARSVTDVAADISAQDPYVWLDPATMQKAVGAVVAAMSSADPQAAALFRRNAEGVTAQLQSLGIDYSSTFASCPGTTIVTPDRAFSAMAAEYSLHDSVVGPNPTPASISALVSSLPVNATTAGIDEPWVDGSGVTQAASTGHFKVHQVPTLASAPVDAPAGTGTYFAQMEQVLGQLSGALGCRTQEQ